MAAAALGRARGLAAACGQGKLTPLALKRSCSRHLFLRSPWLQLAGSSRAYSTGGMASVEVVRSHSEGLLVSRTWQPSSSSSSSSSSNKATARGTVFEHEGTSWVLVFEVDRYWYAAPMGTGTDRVDLLRPGEVRNSISSSPSSGSRDDGGAAVSSVSACLQRPTPVQAERALLTHGLPSGVMAVDVLAPVGLGQSMLICGPQGAGKSTLAGQVLNHALNTGRVDKVVRFVADMGTEPALQRTRAQAELVVAPRHDQDPSSAALLDPLFQAVAAAEAFREDGLRALLVLDTVNPLLSAWDLAVRLAEAERGSPMDTDSMSAQRRSCFAGLLERAASLQRGGSLTMLAVLETEAMAALGIVGAVSSSASSSAGALTFGEKSTSKFSLSDFADRRAGELERLRRLEDRGIPLTEQTLAAVGIAAPKKSHSAASTADADAASAAGRAARELQSLSDGQVVLDGPMAARGEFPAAVPGASFSRFGLGSTGGSGGESVAEQAKQLRDVRPAALQAVAAHLRTLLALEQEAHFRPTAEAVDSHQSLQLKAVRAAMLQAPDAPLRPEEMTALLLAACSGALQGLPGGSEGAASALRGGALSPLLKHMRAAAPQVLRQIAEEPQLSTAAAKELEVSVRLFVKLQQAEAAMSAA
eukprot:TRINITY_DN27736_c0_g1_i1.p1 TRINITY_DN27736_c0_g1~~TRINITY_DN27736_c0_g1_i1.p1  ORF type:complete len:645 (+),score=156.51 TRINITY_DN27736_c0_g1_i1:42-1976(+)